MEESQAPATPSEEGNVGASVDTVSRVFGNDLWLRFDMWANRAWETAQKAMNLAEQSPVPMSSDDAFYDPRIGALYHAASIAQGFAEMVNPMVVLGAGEDEAAYDTTQPVGVTIDMMVENEELD